MKPAALAALTLLATGCQPLRQTSTQPRTLTVAVNRASLTYLEQGRGPPVVFLHGAVADHRMWEPQRAAVAARYRFIAVTMRYFGTAPWPDSGAHFSQATHVADVAAFIRQLNTGPVYVVGHSYGSLTALALAIQHPQLVRALFLNEPGAAAAVTDSLDREEALRDRRGITTVAATARGGDRTETARQWTDFVNGSRGSFDSLPAAFQAMIVDNARTVPLQLRPGTQLPLTCGQLAEIRAPVAITRGELTRPYYRITVGAVARCVPGARLIPIRGARHRAPSQNSRAFNEALLSFLERH